jgi:uncharacterized protein YjbJ (UPF0337 family)
LLGDAESLLGDAKSSLGDAKSSLGDAKSSLGDAKSSLGDAKSSLGDAKSSLGDAESSLGDAKSWLGDTKSSLGDANLIAFTTAATADALGGELLAAHAALTAKRAREAELEARLAVATDELRAADGVVSNPQSRNQPLPESHLAHWRRDAGP